MMKRTTLCTPMATVHHGIPSTTCASAERSSSASIEPSVVVVVVVVAVTVVVVTVVVVTVVVEVIVELVVVVVSVVVAVTVAKVAFASAAALAAAVSDLVDAAAVDPKGMWGPFSQDRCTWATPLAVAPPLLFRTCRTVPWPVRYTARGASKEFASHAGAAMADSIVTVWSRKKW